MSGPEAPGAPAWPLPPTRLRELVEPSYLRATADALVRTPLARLQRPDPLADIHELQLVALGASTT